MAVCAGGSALHSPSGGGLLYSQLLAEVPAGLRWLIPVIGGNDFYKKGHIVDFQDHWLAAVEELSCLATAKAESVLAVVGFSSKVWQYGKHMSRSQCELYDSHVRQLKESFEACCVPAISGADEFVGGLGRSHWAYFCTG